MLLPGVALGGGGFVAFFPRDFHAEEHDEVAFDAEVVFGAVGEFVAEEAGRAVFAVKLHEFVEGADVGILLRMFPKWGAETGVEFVVEGEEVADVVPHDAEVVVEEVAHGGAELHAAVVEGLHEGVALGADDHEGGGFEGLDEAAGVADGDDVVHAHFPVAPGAEFDDAGLAFDAGIFAHKLGAGLVVGDEVGAEDVAAIDDLFVLDFPRPASVHGLGGGEGEDGFVFLPVPAGDDGAVAEEHLVEALEGDFERLAEKLGAEAAGIDVQVGFEFAPVVEVEGGDSLWAAFDITYGGVGNLDAGFACDAF